MTKKLKKPILNEVIEMATGDLCNELSCREGVNHMFVEPYAIKEINLKVEGPCRVLIVYD